MTEASDPQTHDFTEPEVLLSVLVPGHGDEALAAFDFALEHPAQAVPVLRGVVERVVETLRAHDGDLAALDVRDGKQLWIVLLLLAEHGDTASHEAIVALAESFRPLFDSVLQPLDARVVGQILGRTAGERVAPIRRLLDQAELGWLIRGAAVRALTWMAVNDVEGVDAGTLADFLEGSLVVEVPDDADAMRRLDVRMFNTHLVQALCDLGPAHALPEIRKVFAAGLHEGGDVQLGLVEMFAAQDASSVHWSTYDDMSREWREQLEFARQALVVGYVRTRRDAFDALRARFDTERPSRTKRKTNRGKRGKKRKR